MNATQKVNSTFLSVMERQNMTFGDVTFQYLTVKTHANSMELLFMKTSFNLPRDYINILI